MVFRKSKKGASPGAEPTHYVTNSSNSDGSNTAKDSGRGKIMGVFSFCKVVTFALLLWLVQCSSMYSDASMKGHYNMGRAAAVRPSRLLGQPFVEFDTVFDLYQRSFLDKMGCDSNQKDQIRTMMKSYFDKIDLGALAQQFQQNPCSMLQCPPGMPGMFPPMKPGTCPPGFPDMCPPGPGACSPAFPGMCEPSNASMLQGSNANASKNADPEKKKEGEEGTSNDGDKQVTKEQQDGKREDVQKTQMIIPFDNSNNSPVLQYLNFFNFLWSTSFIIMSAVISACFGQFQLTMALFSVLFLKGFNFLWTLKRLHDMFFPKKIKWFIWAIRISLLSMSSLERRQPQNSTKLLGWRNVM